MATPAARLASLATAGPPHVLHQDALMTRAAKLSGMHAFGGVLFDRLGGDDLFHGGRAAAPFHLAEATGNGDLAGAGSH